MRKFNDFMEKLSFLVKVFDYGFIFSCVYILSYQIPIFRTIGKGVCVYFSDRVKYIELSNVKIFYFSLEPFFWTLILISIVIHILFYIMQLIYECCTDRKNGETVFERSIFKYLQDKTASRCFLYTGQWGAGKTHELNQFIRKYYSYTRTKIYRISCFGLGSRKELIEELEGVIERNDDSLFKKCLEMLRVIPVLGDAIYKILKKTYSISSIKKNAIFIFEDFERITSNPQLLNRNGDNLFRKSFSGNYTVSDDYYREFNSIESDLSGIDKAFCMIDDYGMRNLLCTEYDKYAAIVGLINELIEDYSMKVIVVCNTNALDNNFVHDVLRSKLNCFEYNKTVNKINRSGLIKNVIDNKTIDDKKKESTIKKYLEYLNENIDVIGLDDLFDDLRIFGTLIEAFIDISIQIDRELLSINFMDSLINSIMIIHLDFYKSKTGKMSRIIRNYYNGGNINFLLKMFDGPISSNNLIQIDKTKEIRWIEKWISGSWIYNFPYNVKWKDSFLEWKNYKYSDLESMLIDNSDEIMNIDDCNLVHILYFEKNNSISKTYEWDCNTVVSNALDKYNLNSIDDVDYILYYMDHILHGYRGDKLIETIFEKLSVGNAEGTLKGNTLFHLEYKNYLSKQNENTMS